MKSKYCLILLLISFLGGEVSAQDPNFSQFYNNTLYYNPGMTAIGNGMSWRLNARNLWAPIAGKFNTFSASIDAEAVNKTGLGFLAFSDVAGEGLLRTQGANAYYSYRPVETRKFILQLGLSGGIVHKSIDWSQFTFSDQLDEVFGKVNATAFSAPSYTQIVYPDFSTGAAVRFNSGKFESKDHKMTTTLGVAFHHLTSPRDAFIADGARLPLKWLIHGNTSILHRGLIYAPGFIFERQNQFQTFTIGANLVKSPVFAGIWFRNRTYAMNVKSYDSFIFNLGLNTSFSKTTRMRITYGYDFTVSRLKTASMGTHEVSLVFDFDKKVLFQQLQDKRKARSRNQFKVCVDF